MKKERLDKLIKFRVRKEQKDILQKVAEKQKESLSDFARKKLLGDLIK